MNCKDCGIILSKENSYWRERYSKIEFRSRCKSCYSLDSKKRHVKNYERDQERNWQNAMILKFQVLCHYSQTEFRFKKNCEKCGMRDFEYASPKCKNCGETDSRCLSLDHVVPCRTRGRENNLYERLRRENYPEGFQVLCMNCQWKKRVTNGELKQ